MNEPDPLIRRLATANPVPDQDVEGAGGSTSATRILDRIVDDERRGRAGWMLGRRRWGAAAALLVVAAVVGLVVRSATQAPATASELLRRTAVVAANQQRPSGAGPYVYSKIQVDQVITSGEGGQVWSAVLPVSEETWVAPDGSGRIRSEIGEPRFLGSRDRSRWLEAGSPGFETGVFDEVLPAGGLVFGDARSLPTDPDDLLEVLPRQVAEETLPSEVAVFQRIGELLASGDASPELRAALYRVAARLPGIQLLGEVTDPVGRPGLGVAITYAESGARIRMLMIFDDASSTLLAQEQILLEPAAWIDAQPNTRIAFTAYLRAGQARSVRHVPRS